SRSSPSCSRSGWRCWGSACACWCCCSSWRPCCGSSSSSASDGGSSRNPRNLASGQEGRSPSCPLAFVRTSTRSYVLLRVRTHFHAFCAAGDLPPSFPGPIVQPPFRAATVSRAPASMIATPPNPTPETLRLHIVSETAHLRQLVVHTPGDEMALVSPENKDELLFDDILLLDRAQAEHTMLCPFFETVVGPSGAVLQLSTLLREAFESEAARQDYVASLIEALPTRNFEAYERELNGLDADGLHRFALTGQAPFPVSAHPLPNLLFTRDL